MFVAEALCFRMEPWCCPSEPRAKGVGAVGQRELARGVYVGARVGVD